MPIPGNTPEASQTSSLEYTQGSFGASADANWRINRKLSEPIQTGIHRYGSPNLSAMLLHSDTTSTDCVSVEIGYMLCGDAEADDWGSNPLPTNDWRRIFGLQRWLQNGSQPPVQSSRMGKLITLHEARALWIATKFTQVSGTSLTGATLGFAWRASLRRTFT